MPRRKEGGKLESEDDAMKGVMEDDEETVEMESPVKAFEESMDEVKTMTPTSLRSADSLEQLDLADSTPCRSEGSSEGSNEENRKQNRAARNGTTSQTSDC